MLVIHYVLIFLNVDFSGIFFKCHKLLFSSFRILRLCKLLKIVSIPLLLAFICLSTIICLWWFIKLWRVFWLKQGEVAVLKNVLNIQDAYLFGCFCACWLHFYYQSCGHDLLFPCPLFFYEINPNSRVLKENMWSAVDHYW